MGSSTGIEWTDATWNPIRGCSRVSEGCRNCYAERVAHRFSGAGQPYEGLTQLVNGHAAWTGKVDLVEKHLLDPLKWKAVKVCCGTENLPDRCPRCTTRPRRIFVNSMSDLFHPNVPDEWIDRIFAVMALCPQHTFQILTKRPERMLAWFNLKRDIGMSKASAATTAWHVWTKVSEIQNMVRRVTRCPFMWDQAAPDADAILGWPLPNVQLGVSVEDQKTADERIPLLLQTPAAVRFISAEPLLGEVCLARWTDEGLECECGWFGLETEAAEAGPEDDRGFSCPKCGEMCAHTPLNERLGDGLDWVICGGESGPGARPMHPDWARGLRDQCVAAGVPFFFKQWGEWGPYRKDQNSYGSPALVQTEAGYKKRCVHVEKGDGTSGYVQRVGKKAAGSLLDGCEWKEFPRCR